MSRLVRLDRPRSPRLPRSGQRRRATRPPPARLRRTRRGPTRSANRPATTARRRQTRAASRHLLGRIRSTPRIAGHRHRHHDTERARPGRPRDQRPDHRDASAGTHRRRLSPSDARPDPDGRQLNSLSGGVRGSHQPSAVSRPHQTRRLRRPTHHLLRPRPRLHPAGLYRARLSLRSPPRPTLGRTAAAPTPTACSSAADPTTPCSARAFSKPRSPTPADSPGPTAPTHPKPTSPTTPTNYSPNSTKTTKRTNGVAETADSRRRPRLPGRRGRAPRRGR